jgi:hypothetical protein
MNTQLLEAFAQEQASAHQKVAQWRQWCHELCELGDPRFGEMGTRLEQIRNELSLHFAHEEQSRCFDEIVLTHPYEGGHTDHDATAFAVHLACGVLRREGVPAPIVLELTSYHNRDGRRVHSEFLPFWPVPTRRVDLPHEAQLLKARMFRYFTTQQKVLSAFPLNVERFRIAPRYIFTVPPHEGPLDYERYCTTISGAEWRANAEKALHILRAKRRINTRRAS